MDRGELRLFVLLFASWCAAVFSALPAAAAGDQHPAQLPGAGAPEGDPVDSGQARRAEERRKVTPPPGEITRPPTRG